MRTMKTAQRQNPQRLVRISGVPCGIADTRRSEQLPEAEKAAEIRQRQRSMLNALLCCAI